MKVDVYSRKGDVSVELATREERTKFAESLPQIITAHDYKYAVMNDEYGEAKFDTLEGLLKALKNYED